MDYISGLWSRHCQGDTPAGGQGRAIELPVAHHGVPLREFRVLLLPGQGQGRSARAQGQALEEETTSPGASGSTQSVTTRGCRHFDIENKYQPVKLTLFLVSFCRRGSKYLKGFSLCLVLKKGLGVWPYPGPYLVLSTPTSLSTEGRRGPVK